MRASASYVASGEAPLLRNATVGKTDRTTLLLPFGLAFEEALRRMFVTVETSG